MTSLARRSGSGGGAAVRRRSCADLRPGAGGGDQRRACAGRASCLRRLPTRSRARTQFAQQALSEAIGAGQMDLAIETCGQDSAGEADD